MAAELHEMRYPDHIMTLLATPLRSSPVTPAPHCMICAPRDEVDRQRARSVSGLVDPQHPHLPAFLPLNRLRT